MKHIVLVAGLLLAAFGASAASEQIIKQRAINIRDQNANRTTAGQTPIPGRPVVVPNTNQPTKQFVTNPPANHLTDEQQRLLRVQNSLTVIRAGAPIDPVEKAQFEKDILNLVVVGKKPAHRSVAKVSEGVCGALSQRMLSRPTQARLVQNLNIAMNPGRHTKVQVDKAISDTQALFESNNLPKKDAEKIATDLKALSAEVGTPKTS